MLSNTKFTSMIIPIMLVILTCGCTSTAEDVSVQSSNSPLGIVTETPIVSWDVPSNYVTHTDSTGLFSISYPPNWREDPYARGLGLFPTKVLVDRVDAGEPIEYSGIIFAFGLPSNDSYSPYCDILVESRPDSISSSQQFLQEKIIILDRILDEFIELSQYTLIIDGRESAILEYVSNSSEVEIHSLELYTIFDETIWTTRCSLREDNADFSDYKEEIENIVMSLKIHR